MQQRNARTRIAVAAAISAALVVGLASASAQPGRGRGQSGRGSGQQHQMRRARPPGMHIMGAEDVDVNLTENNDGVTILVTSEKAELAERIQKALPEHIERMKQMKPAREPAAARPGGRNRFCPFTGEGVDVEFVNKDNGLAIVLASDDEKVAQQIKTAAPRRIEMMKSRQGPPGQRMGAGPDGAHNPRREWLRLITSENVDVKMEETDDGAKLAFSSQDPKTVERIREMVAKQLEHIAKARERRDERGDEEGPPAAMRRSGDRQGNRPGRGAGPTDDRGPRRNRPEADDADIRKIVREEVRRALQDVLQDKDE